MMEKKERTAGGMNSFTRIVKAAEKNAVDDVRIAFRETMEDMVV